MVIVKDNDRPTLELVGAGTLFAEAGCAFVDPYASAFDNVDGVLSSKIVRRIQSSNDGQFLSAGEPGMKKKKEEEEEEEGEEE